MLGYETVSRSLISVVRQGRLERARKLIDSYGLSYSPAWSGGYVLLCYALEKNHVAVAKLLLTSGSRVNKKDNNNRSNTPLHFAVINGETEIVKMLLDKGANINAKNEGGRTPLHNATQYKKMEVTELLLKHRADVNATDNDGTSPLHFAVINGDVEIVKMILDKGANIDAKDQYGRTPLHNAIEYRKIKVTELLLKHRADVNATDNDGTSPLHFATETGCLQLVEHLLKYGAHVNCMCTQISMYPIFSKKGALHIAVEKGNEEVVTLLLSRDAIVDVKGEDNMTPLHIAAKKGYMCIAEDLLNHGACIHSLTLKEGYMPLHFASELNNEETVKLFLNRGADIHARTKSNLTPLHIATNKGHKTVVNLLLQHGAEVDNQDKDEKTVLHLALENGYLTIIEDILNYCPDIRLEYGLIVSPKDANNSELLHAAVEKGYLKIIEDLLKYGADVNLTFEEGFTPLHSAAKNKQEEVAKLLISYGADINAQDKAGKTPIFYAIESTDLKITKLLLTNRANIKGSPELLNIAVQKECIEIVEALLQHDADINATDNYGRTALHFTAMSENEGALCEALCVHCFTFERGIFTNEDIKGEIAELLLSKGAIVDAQTKFGLTTLHVAASKKYTKVVKALLKYNANVNSMAQYHIRPFVYSILGENEKTGLILLTLDDITPLHLAAKKGYREITETLLKFGADINITCRDNLTPLDYAMKRLHLLTANALKRHIVKMKTVNLYVSEKNLRSLTTSDEISDFQDECEEEIARMKSHKINNAIISLYDILVKDTSSVAIYMKNENIVQVLESNDYKTKFPIYASMIENNFKRGKERKKLLEQGNNIFHFLFNKFHELRYNCSEKIFSYLSVEDLRTLILIEF